MEYIHTLFNRAKLIPAIVCAMSIAGTASASVTFTNLDRRISVPGSSDSSNNLFTQFESMVTYSEDTGGVFAGAFSRASQSSLLDNATQTLTFDGSASAGGGATGGSSSSNTLNLDFTVGASMTAEMLLTGDIFGRNGGGIDPGSSGGIGTARIQIFQNGNLFYNNFSGTAGTTIVNDFLTLDTGNYRLNIVLSASGFPQTNSGLGRADLTVEFIPTPGTATIALAFGLITTRRRR
ncbi:MAG: hypothetical protein AB8C13_07850 [Phycisphaerales bacterium]